MSIEKANQRPAYYGLITESLVKSALRSAKGGATELNSWDIEDFTKKGDKYISAVTRIRVSYILEGKPETTTFIVKMNPKRNLEDYHPLVASFCKKEGRFYEEVVPELNATLTGIGLDDLKVPKWFHNSLENDKEIIFLEDLSPRGFRMFDRRKGFDVPHTLLVLEELARFHAASKLLQAKFPEENLADKYSFLKADWHNFSEKGEELFNLMFSPHFDNSKEILQKMGGYELAVKWLTENKPKCVEIFKRQMVPETPFDVICHGDCLNNNLLFRYDAEDSPVEVMLVDLQISRVASLATDLNYFMYTSFKGDGRKNNLSAFIDSYYNSFQKVLQAAKKAMPFTSQQLWQEYRKKNEYGFLFAIMIMTGIITPAEDIPDMDTTLTEEELAQFNAEWRLKALSMIDTNPLFRPRFLAIYDDAIENGIIV